MGVYSLFDSLSCLRAGCGYTVLHARVLSIDAAHIYGELSPFCARTIQLRMQAPRRQCAIFASWKALLAATSVATRPCSRAPLCRGWPLAAVAGALRMPPHPAGGLPVPTASAECVERDRTRGLSQSTMVCAYGVSRARRACVGSSTAESLQRRPAAVAPRAERRTRSAACRGDERALGCTPGTICN